MYHLLAADRVYHFYQSPDKTVSFYLTLFTLTENGGLVSVTLSLGSLPVAVSNCPSLCCPDFPLAKKQAISR